MATDQLELGLDTFGDVTSVADGSPLSHAQVIRNVIDEAVLQRGKPVAVWGWAAPGAEVTVVLAGDGLTATPTKVKAGPDGRWQAAIGPFQAGGPYTLTANAGDRKVASLRELMWGTIR